MKKIILSLAMVAMSAVAVNAQLLVGGSIGMNAASGLSTTKNVLDGKTTITKNPLSSSTFGFSINPTVGYVINNFEVGVSVGLGGDFSKTKVNPIVDGKPITDILVTDNVASLFNWSINPYARYYFFQSKGWGIAIQGDINVGGSKVMDVVLKPVDGIRTAEDIRKINEANETKKKERALKGIEDIDSNVNWSISFAPVITYTVKEHWVLVSRLGFLGLGVFGNVAKNGTINTKENTEKVRTTSNTNFNLNLLQQSSANLISFGCVYKF